MSEKQIINDVYFDRAGFGSKNRTLEEAREKDKTITMSDINEFFGRMLIKNESPSVQIALSPPILHMSIRWTYSLLMI